MTGSDARGPPPEYYLGKVVILPISWFLACILNISFGTLLSAYYIYICFHDSVINLRTRQPTSKLRRYVHSPTDRGKDLAKTITHLINGNNIYVFTPLLGLG